VNADQKAAEILLAASEFTAKLGSMLPQPMGLAMLGVSALAKASAEAVRARGETISQILQRIREPRDVAFPWDGDEPTTRETPAAKKKGDSA
jgi:hypothetical protein